MACVVGYLCVLYRIDYFLSPVMGTRLRIHLEGTGTQILENPTLIFSCSHWEYNVLRFQPYIFSKSNSFISSYSQDGDLEIYSGRKPPPLHCGWFTAHLCHSIYIHLALLAGSTHYLLSLFLSFLLFIVQFCGTNCFRSCSAGHDIQDGLKATVASCGLLLIFHYHNLGEGGARNGC